ncbi:MAG: alpha-(1-_3)-arabinofuranosyltransferase family protein [Acidimicrobiia bacterium]
MRRARARRLRRLPLPTSAGPARLRGPLAALAAVVYVPLLLTAPGQVSADTKAYLYLDPGGLLSRATAMWDPGLALGYVPHQNIGYLWPMGPWYWAFDALGFPDWVAQRLWWGTLLFAAGAGVAALLRRFGWSAEAVWAASFVYALTPYVLTLLARISAILVPYAALPWLLLLAVLAVRAQGWRHPALFALLAATAGSVNLTALVLVGVAPALWLVFAATVTKEIRPLRALATAVKMAVLTTLVSAWWLVGLGVQATHGTDVLRYSETAEAVASTSTATESLRGLGYWFFYGEDRLGPWIEPSVHYTQDLWLLVVTFLLPAAGLLGAAVARWRYRAFFVGLATAGLLMAVGPYPWSDPPPLGRGIRELLETSRGLAMRSLPRAAPLLVLSLAVLLGAGVAALVARRPRQGRWLSGAAVLAAILALPPLWTGGTVPENLRRPEEVPGYWQEAADRIDDGGSSTRVLEIPGSDFAAYRWGNTVDPITPGLVDRGVAYRELIPFGPPESAAALVALDLGLQERTLDPEALAPMARLLRAGDLVVRSDLEYERYHTPRPRDLWDLVARAPGLGEPDGFGPGAPNRPRDEASLDDELWLLGEADLPDPPEVAVVPVEDPVAVVATHGTDAPLVVAGDAFGLVDAAAAGLIDGSELIRFSAGLDDDELDTVQSQGAALLITDTNRKRGQRWGTIRYTQGFTEPAEYALLEDDPSDRRLPFHDEAGTTSRTVAVYRGVLSATASSYGNPFVLAPEERPINAVDGDPRTAWRTAGFADARGQRLRIDLDEPVTTDRVRLLQPTTGTLDRWVTEVRLRFDDGRDPVEVTLDEASHAEPGQLVRFPQRTFSRVEVEIVADTAGDQARFIGLSSVGFAEVRIGDRADLFVEEWIRTPVDLVPRLNNRSVDHALAVVLTRQRQDPLDATRDDPERRIARLVTLPQRRQYALTGTARLSARAADEVLDAALGRGGTVVVGATARMLGTRGEVGSAALDGDPTTAWLSPRGAPTGHGVVVTTPGPVTFDRLDLQVLADGRHSVPTEVEVVVDGRVVTTATLDDVATGRPGHVAATPVELDRPVTGSRIEVRVTGAAEATVTDWASRQPIAQPVGIAELGIPGLSVPARPERFDSGCRTDLVEVDGLPIAVQVTGRMDDALAGRPLRLAACEDRPLELDGGQHALRTALGVEVGIDVDRLVLRSDPGGAAATGAATLVEAAGGQGTTAEVTVVDESATHLTVDLEGEPGTRAWLVLGQSHNRGWSARVEGSGDLGPPELVDGFANGWLVQLDEDGRARVELDFGPQGAVRLGLVVSGVSGLACLLMAWRGRRCLDGPTARPDPLEPIPVLHYEGALPRRGRAALVGVGVAVGAVLVVPPPAAAVLGVVAALGCRRERVRGWLVLAAPLLAAASGAYVVVQQFRNRILPGFNWPAEHGRVHHAALLAVLVLFVDAVVDRTWRKPDDPR